VKLRLLKVAIFLVCLVPLARLGLKGLHGELGANPIEVITHSTGDWTMILLLATLSITPLRMLTRQYWIIGVRRMLGLFAFFYGCLHFTTYIWLDKFFDVHAMLQDIAKRKFITVGFLGFVLLIPLAVTSTAGWIRRQPVLGELPQQLVIEGDAGAGGGGEALTGLADALGGKPPALGQRLFARHGNVAVFCYAHGYATNASHRKTG